RAGIVPLPAVQSAITTPSASPPHDHFAAGPKCRVRLSGKWCIDRAGRRPRVAAWIVSAARIQIARQVIPTPDDHLAPGPRYRVKLPAIRCVGGAHGTPTIGCRIVSAPGVQKVRRRIIESTPYNHFA